MYLFPRTCREKETWFRHLLSATQETLPGLDDILKKGLLRPNSVGGSTGGLVKRHSMPILDPDLYHEGEH